MRNQILFVVASCVVFFLAQADTVKLSPVEEFVKNSKSSTFYGELKSKDRYASMFDVEPKVWFAAVFGYEDIVKSELRSGKISPADGTKALLGAAHMGRLEIVKMLVNSGIPVNASIETGSTPLMEAAQTNRIEVMRFLIEMGANVNDQNKDRIDALIVSVFQGHIEAVCALLSSGFEIARSETANGDTPLQLAQRLGFSEIEAVLIANESDRKKLCNQNSKMRSFKGSECLKSRFRE